MNTLKVIMQEKQLRLFSPSRREPEKCPLSLESVPIELMYYMYNVRNCDW